MGVTKQIIKPGNGPKPKRGQTITVHCTGFLDNGKKFWSTKDTNEPFSFQVGVQQVRQTLRDWHLSFTESSPAERTFTPNFAFACVPACLPTVSGHSRLG